MLVIGPCIALPAILAAHGKHVMSTRSKEELRRIIESKFSDKKWSKTGGLGEMNYKLGANFMDVTMAHGNGPTVSVDFSMQSGATLVSIWMSESTSGGLNKGKGTPFYTLGASRAYSKINEVAKLIEEPQSQSQNTGYSTSTETYNTNDTYSATNGAVGLSSTSNTSTSYCPYCGKEVKANSKFCRHCGRDIQGANG